MQRVHLCWSFAAGSVASTAQGPAFGLRPPNPKPRTLKLHHPKWLKHRESEQAMLKPCSTASAYTPKSPVFQVRLLGSEALAREKMVKGTLSPWPRRCCAVLALHIYRVGVEG